MFVSVYPEKFCHASYGISEDEIFLLMNVLGQSLLSLRGGTTKQSFSYLH